MNKCPDCQIEPISTHDVTACVCCSQCGRTTQSYAYGYMAEEAWNNGDTKSKEELKQIWENIKEAGNTRYYAPPDADLNFTNNDAAPPEVEYEEDKMVLDRNEVFKVTKTKKD